MTFYPSRANKDLFEKWKMRDTSKEPLLREYIDEMYHMAILGEVDLNGLPDTEEGYRMALEDILMLEHMGAYRFQELISDWERFKNNYDRINREKEKGTR